LLISLLEWSVLGRRPPPSSNEVAADGHDTSLCRAATAPAFVQIAAGTRPAARRLIGRRALAAVGRTSVALERTQSAREAARRQ